MDVNKEDMIWVDFMLKVDALVTYGYSMPYDIQLRAVYTLDQQLIKWKQRLVVKADNVICDDNDDNSIGNMDHDDMAILPVKLDSSDMPSKMSNKNKKRKLHVRTPIKSTIGCNKDDKISDEDTWEDNTCETKHLMGNKRSRKRSNRIDVQLESSCPNEKIDVKQKDHSIGKGDVCDEQLASVDKVNDDSDSYCDACNKTYSSKASFRNHMLIHKRGGEGVNHVKRDWLEILNVNCDLYLFFCVKRDWGYLRET